MDRNTSNQTSRERKRDPSNSGKSSDSIDGLDALRLLDPDNNVPLEKQYEVLTEEEQKRVLQKLVIQNESDIQAFSTFLKLPTVVILMLNLVFAYNYAMGSFRSIYGQHASTLPFVSYEILTDSPIIATEISVVILQFSFYLLSYGRWDRSTQWGMGVLVGLGLLHAVTCRKNGVLEFLWWVLPVLNLLVVSYAQLNMRRSRRDIEELAKRTYHVKSA
ncbi:hypothetical protein GGI12_004504 [Dipsacomyces acuminosporus]|nr:hypothetical protein GGI12_004504 [Dipsacomyces acuminosporus]